MAAFAAAYTPHHRLAVSLPFLHDELIDAGFARPGIAVSPAMIDLCTAALRNQAVRPIPSRKPGWKG